jgi:hypothetical protein
MTLKSAFTNAGDVAFINIQETYGGQNIDIRFSIEMMELVKFWREWTQCLKTTIQASWMHLTMLKFYMR